MAIDEPLVYLHLFTLGGPCILSFPGSEIKPFSAVVCNLMLISKLTFSRLPQGAGWLVHLCISATEKVKGQNVRSEKLAAAIL